MAASAEYAMFVQSEQARECAGTVLQSGLVQGDPAFESWSGATVGEPLLVRDLQQEPSYWLVPVVVSTVLVGFVRVLGDGRVSAVGALPSGGRDTSITGISAAEASRRAAEHLRRGETASAPVFVHDGPPGREAWLVVVSAGDIPTRWVFVTPAFVYERPAGQLRDEALE